MVNESKIKNHLCSFCPDEQDKIAGFITAQGNVNSQEKYPSAKFLSEGIWLVCLDAFTILLDSGRYMSQDTYTQRHTDTNTPQRRK